MSSPQSPFVRQTDANLVDMLAGVNANASMPAIQRTRRNVLAAVDDRREQRKLNRRNVAIVALTVTVLGMLLTPAIWSVVDDILGGEHFDELPGVVMVMVLLLFSTVISVLIMSFKNLGLTGFGRHGRR